MQLLLRLSATETSPHKGAAAAGAGAGGSILSATNLSSSNPRGGRGGAAAASGAAADGGEAGSAAAKGPLEKVDCGSLCKSLAKVRTRTYIATLPLTELELGKNAVRQLRNHRVWWGCGTSNLTQRNWQFATSKLCFLAIRGF